MTGARNQRFLRRRLRVTFLLLLLLLLLLLEAAQVMEKAADVGEAGIDFGGEGSWRHRRQKSAVFSSAGTGRRGRGRRWFGEGAVARKHERRRDRRHGRMGRRVSQTRRRTMHVRRLRSAADAGERTRSRRWRAIQHFLSLFSLGGREKCF